MATGDPLILGKPNNVANNQSTIVTRVDNLQTSGRNVLWVHGTMPDAQAIRADGLGSGQGVLAVNHHHGVGMWGMSQSGIAVMGDAFYDGRIPLGIGVGAFSKSGVGIWAECAKKDIGFAGIFQGLTRVNGDFEVFGTKAAVVPHPDGSMRRLYCVESPESWFEDFGEARLKGGKAEVRIDPKFAALVRGPFQVFLTPYGESNGLYVGRRTSKSFVVREQGGGKSSVSFGYRIVARRKDVDAPRLAKVARTPDLKRPKAEKIEPLSARARRGRK
jgi:hypothetical protein